MEIDIDELNRVKEKNLQERLAFIDLYVAWLKKTPNKVWSKIHSEFIDSVYETDESR